ncbi:MCE family protein [Mycobacterium sp.]|uniref:MCE family protein n=1 Tax=Mycobacterium sp. TaxID=1785 RepID=UPI002D8A326B|nr:MCE family protein [Mycobacterium sp.]
MDEDREGGLSPRWWTAILVVAVVAFVVICSAQFSGQFRSVVPVTLTADRAGLVMESGAKVKMRGVVVGRVGDIRSGTSNTELVLQLNPDQVQYIPANVGVRIEASTAFGAKYVDLLVPADPSAKRIQAGAVLTSDNVSTEVNTVFESLTAVLRQVDPADLNATLTALSEGLRGKGDRIGEAISAADDVIKALNSRTDVIAADFRSLKGFADAYGDVAPDLLAALDAVSTTATTITDHSTALDALLLNVIGLSQSGTDLLAPNQKNLITAVNNLAPTTELLLKYSPSFTCLLVGADWLLHEGGSLAGAGGNGYSTVVDAAILFGDDVYRYPENLPKVNAKGGPGGKPGCGSLPIAPNNFPVKQLVTDTGWGTAPNEIRTNPGIGHPFYVNNFPVTRAVPEPPSYRGMGPPAPGPFPFLIPPPPPSQAGPPAAPPEAPGPNNNPTP